MFSSDYFIFDVIVRFYKTVQPTFLFISTGKNFNFWHLKTKYCFKTTILLSCTSMLRFKLIVAPNMKQSPDNGAFIRKSVFEFLMCNLTVCIFFFYTNGSCKNRSIIKKIFMKLISIFFFDSQICVLHTEAFIIFLFFDFLNNFFNVKIFSSRLNAD